MEPLALRKSLGIRTVKAWTPRNKNVGHKNIEGLDSWKNVGDMHTEDQTDVGEKNIEDLDSQRAV